MKVWKRKKGWWLPFLDNAPNYVVGCVFQKRYTLPGWDSVGQGLTEHEWGILYSNVYGQLFCAVDIELS